MAYFMLAMPSSLFNELHPSLSLIVAFLKQSDSWFCKFLYNSKPWSITIFSFKNAMFFLRSFLLVVFGKIVL
ncbi:hypothetical protein BD408DRAFT_414841 [Parasitella parasitica]|nr:hypothetical protein BD408DRAFT_414841 [Parasitella parasitica]